MATSFEGNGSFNRKFENLLLFRQGQLSVTKKLFNEAKIKAPTEGRGHRLEISGGLN